MRNKATKSYYQEFLYKQNYLMDKKCFTSSKRKGEIEHVSTVLNRHQRWPLGYGREITYWWGTSKISKTVKCLAK